MPNENIEMKMLTALGRFETEHGAGATAALLKKFGAARGIEVKPADFEKVIAACGMVAADDAEEASEEVASDEPDRPAPLNPLAKKSDFQTIIDGAPDTKTGFDRFAKATHARINSKAE